MTTIVYIAIIAAVLVLVGWMSVVTKRRNEAKKDGLRVEAEAIRDKAAAARLEAARQGAMADERTAHAKAANLAAEQQRIGAATTLADAQSLQSQADEIDPDVSNN